MYVLFYITKPLSLLSPSIALLYVDKQKPALKSNDQCKNVYFNRFLYLLIMNVVFE